MRAPSSGVNDDDGGGIDPSPGSLFAIIWEALTEVLGTAAVAAIVRRAVRRAAVESPELLELVILRENLEYRCTLPPSWSQRTGRAPTALHRLVVEIGRLLMDLTGTVVVRRMEQIPKLRAAGLVWRTEGSN